MKLSKVLSVLVLLLVLGGFGWFAIADVPVEKHETIQTIPNERFFSPATDNQ